MLHFYGYRKCSTSNKAEKLLRNAGIEYEFVDITEKPPSVAFLKRLLKAAAQGKGIPVSKLANSSSMTYRELGMTEKLKNLKEDEILSLLVRNSKMIKRPVLSDGERFTVGLKEEEFYNTWIGKKAGKTAGKEKDGQ